MTEYYPFIKSLHVATVIASGTLFAMRGVAAQAGNHWAMAAPVRYLSYVIDTVLLAAAVLLLGILPAAAVLLLGILPATVYANGWLAVKLSLLVVYIGLGTFALKRGRTQAVRLSCFAAAIVVYLAMFSIARSHDPLGPLRMFAGPG
ncbi:MAG: SirB2 family protein [Woeseiaceae bacterium]|nr:SirB2 family protein [Woeseiaceae bacterium]